MSLLTKASEVSTERGRDYDHPLPNHLRIAISWSGILGVNVSPVKVALCMVALKIDRQKATPKWDNLVDIVGYVNCIDMMVSLFAKEYYNVASFEDKTDVEKEAFLKDLDNLDITQMQSLLRQLELSKSQEVCCNTQ